MDTNSNTTKLTPAAIVEQLRALREQIPEFTQLPIATARRLQTAANVDMRFVHASINAISASPTVESGVGTADALRQEAEEAAHWGAVEDAARALLQGVIARNLTRRHRLGTKALQAYSIARQLVRTEEHADLLPHVLEMQRFNRIGRRRKEPQPQPAPQPGTPSHP